MVEEALSISSTFNNFKKRINTISRPFGDKGSLRCPQREIKIGQVGLNKKWYP